MYSMLHLLVPVLLGDPVEAIEHDGYNDLRVLLYQTHYVLVIPEVECTFSNLKNTHTHTHTMYHHTAHT